MKNGANKKNICTECGYCCDGSMFNLIMLTRDCESGLDSQGKELKHVADYSIIVENRKTKEPTICMEMPCPFVEDKKCTVYEERPLTCKAFRCKLLIQYEAGKVSYNDCIEIINKKLMYRFPNAK